MGVIFLRAFGIKVLMKLVHPLASVYSSPAADACLCFRKELQAAVLDLADALRGLGVA